MDLCSFVECIINEFAIESEANKLSEQIMNRRIIKMVKKQYESPKVEKLEFDFSNTVTASARPGQSSFGEGGEQQGYVWNKANSQTCNVYSLDDGCFDD